MVWAMKRIVSPEQEAFCVHWIENRSIPLAYMAAYDCTGLDRERISANGHQVHRKPAVQERIRDLLDKAAAPILFNVSEALGRLVAMATFDRNEIISLKLGACRHCHGADHRYHWRELEYVEAVDRWERDNLARKPGTPESAMPDPYGGLDYDATSPPHQECPTCHGEGLTRVVAKDTEFMSQAARWGYGGVKHTNHGPQILIADATKCIELAVRMMGGFDDKVKIDATVAGVIAAAKLDTTDPQAAVRAYQELIGVSKLG